jgi:pilus assembly protein CpaC
MMAARTLKGLSLCAAAAGALLAAQPALAQVSVATGVGAGELEVPVNKSQVLRVDRPYTKALIGNPDIADIVPISDTSVYVLGKKTGTTSLTLYDGAGRLIAVVDISVGPDVLSLKRQLSEMLPANEISAAMSNDSIVLEGMVRNAVDADRAVQIAETYAPGKVVNLLSLGSSQQVMLEVRFAEVRRSALMNLGLNHTAVNKNGTFVGGVGDAGQAGIPVGGTTSDGSGALDLVLPTAGFASVGIVSHILGLRVSSALDALEQRGLVTTLAEPTLVALSGETASFLAGGEFPIPVAQSGTNGGDAAITVQFKQFGVSLAFTPTVLADGVINLVVAPEVSSIDTSASVVINGISVPGLQTRRAKTVLELRDGESFALAGLLRKDFRDTVQQVPLLGSIPIIGTLFRSTSYQHDQSELVIIVTPRLVRPVMAGMLKVPTDRVGPPNEADLLLLGRTDTAVPPAGRSFSTPPPSPPPPPATPFGGMSEKAPIGFEKDYGHVL